MRRGLPGHGSYREKKLEEAESTPSSGAPEKADEATECLKQDVAEDRASAVTAMDLVAKGGLRRYTLCMNAVWFTVPLSYYVTTFGMPSLTGDRFANFALGAVLEVAAYCVTFVALSRLGRRLPLCAFLASSAVACFGVAFILVGSGDNGGVAALVLVLACKATLVSAFCTMFLYTGELFPTAVRSAALGVCGFVGRVGNLLSPQVVHLGDYGEGWLPFACIGVLLLATSTSTLLLPETLGRELPATLEDARALRVKLRKRRPSAGQRPEDGEQQLLNNKAVARVTLSCPSKLTMEDYKVPDWKSDIPQLEPEQVQHAKKRGSMSALELGQGILEELNKTPSAERTERTRSLYLETNLDDPEVGVGRQQYKTTVASAV